MKKIIFILIVLFSFISQSAMAVDPETGWWWNAAESGRGFSIEQQVDTIFFAAYLYNNSGKDAWYTAVMTKNTAGNFKGTLRQFSDGQTLLGPYQAAKPANNNAGDITLAFNTPTTGTMTWPGGVVPIERFIFKVPKAPSKLNLAGSAATGSNHSDYRFSAASLDLQGAPADTDYNRWGMLSDDSFLRLYFFKQSSDTELYEFIYDGSSTFIYGRFVNPKVIGAPTDTDTSSIAFINESGGPAVNPRSIMYMRKKNSRTVYPLVLNSAGNFEYDTIVKPSIDIFDSPADADFSRWAMDAVSIPDPLSPTTAKTVSSFYTFKANSNTEIYVHEFNGFEFEYMSPKLILSDIPAGGDTSSFATVYSKQDMAHILFQQQTQ